MLAVTDYEELLRLLNKHKVKYCVIGAYAAAFYSKPRYTKDLDLLVEPTKKNGEQIIAALNDFGFGSLKLSEDDFCEEGQIIQLGYEPVRIDLLTSIKGCSFSEVWKNKKRGIYGKVKVYFIGINELIKNKRKSARKQDQADLELLKKFNRKK
ncbi:MAG: nucleotidyltransferase [Candidatus Margulisiibacteriota bacterium]